MRLTFVESAFLLYHIIIILENGEENMAGILLARNNSRIIGVVVNDHEKYEGRVLEDGFVMSSLTIQCLSPAKKYKLYKSSINKSIHFVQRSLSSSTRGQRVTAHLNLS